MIWKFSFFCLAVLGLCRADNACISPSVESSFYTAQDGMVVTEIAFITEFTVKCSNTDDGIPLYAEVNGKLLPVVQVDKTKYQLSWTEEVKKSSSNRFKINIFDEEGYASVRRALRNDEDYSSVKPLTVLQLNYSGPYKGPWINSEFMAAVLCIGVWYFAFTSKSKLLS